MTVRSPTRTPPPSVAGPALDGATLLLVEDDTDFRNELASTLHDSGCHVVLAANGREALGLLRDGSVGSRCVVVADIFMPVMDGTELLLAIRQDWRLAHLPVVLMTGSSFETERALASALGARFLRKPTSAKALLELLEHPSPTR